MKAQVDVYYFNNLWSGGLILLNVFKLELKIFYLNLFKFWYVYFS